MKGNKITKVFRNLALGLVITASGLILETPAHAEGKYWCADTVSYTDEQLAYTYKSATGATVTTNDLGLAQRCAVGDIQTKDGVLQNTQEDRDKAIEQEKINKQLEMQKPENQPISYEEFTKIANEEMLRLVNEHREENGLQPLEWDDTLAKMATEKSEHMAKHHYVGHMYKGGDTPIIQQIMWKVNTSGENCLGNGVWATLTENYAKDRALNMFYQWKESPGHDWAMLRPDHEKLGFGFALDENGYCYATQQFADDDMYDYNDGDMWLDSGIESLDELDQLNVPEDLNCGEGQFYKIKQTIR